MTKKRIDTDNIPNIIVTSIFDALADGHADMLYGIHQYREDLEQLICSDEPTFDPDPVGDAQVRSRLRMIYRNTKITENCVWWKSLTDEEKAEELRDNNNDPSYESDVANATIEYQESTPEELSKRQSDFENTSWKSDPSQPQPCSSLLIPTELIELLIRLRFLTVKEKKK